MLHTFSLQMDTMNIKRKQDEEERDLDIVFPKCIRRHPKNEFPLNVIEVGLVCEENHDEPHDWVTIWTLVHLLDLSNEIFSQFITCFDYILFNEMSQREILCLVD